MSTILLAAAGACATLVGLIAAAMAVAPFSVVLLCPQDHP